MWDTKQPNGKADFRVVLIDRSVFNQWDCNIEIGDLEERWLSQMKDIVQSEKTVSNTISNTTRISGQVVRGETPALTASNIKWTGVTNGLSNGISNLNVKTDNIQLEVNNNKGNIASLTITATQIQSTVTDMNGKMGVMQSQITQTANRISAVVTENGVIKAGVIAQAINSIGYATIRADAIIMTGASINVTGGDLFGATSISGTNITAQGSLNVNSGFRFQSGGKTYNLYVSGEYVKARL